MTYAQSSEVLFDDQEIQARYERNKHSVDELAKQLARLEQNDAIPTVRDSSARYQQISYEFEDIRLQFNYAEPVMNVALSYGVHTSNMGDGREIMTLAKENYAAKNQPFMPHEIELVVPQRYHDRGMVEQGCLQRAAENMVKLSKAIDNGTAKRTVIRPGMA